MARMSELRYMWTLTFPGAGVHDLGRATGLLSRWLRSRPRHDRKLTTIGEGMFGGAYVAVPELHPNGHGWHWHLLTNRRVDVNRVRISWTAFLQGEGMARPGQLVRVNAKLWDSARAAGSYAAKYVTKSFDRAEIPAGTHRYRVGDALGLADPAYALVLGGDVWDAADRVCRDVLGLEEGSYRVILGSGEHGPPGAWVGW